MKIQIRYFAGLREALGAGQTIDVSAPCSLAALRAQLQASSALHAERLGPGRAVRCALNQVMQAEAALASVLVNAGDEVAFFPPVTGG